jgi:CheY-like chemotaxis protein
MNGKQMSVANNNAKSGKFIQALLVDDDKFMLEFVGDLLRELGVMTVTTAADGTQGLVAFDRAAPKPDLILCDLHMPGQDGFQFMAALAGRGYRGGVILISGQDARTLKSATLMAQFHELNILATLEKPVDKMSLINAMAKLG